LNGYLDDRRTDRNPGKLAYLKEIDIAYGQAHLFGKPYPTADLTMRGNSQKNPARREKKAGVSPAK
jgi:hypothetical protein